MAAAAGERRPDRWLRDRIPLLLVEADEPLSATTLVRRLRSDGESIASSAVFRALRHLMASGLVDRVELISAYLPRRDEDSATAMCSRCGGYTELKRTAPVAGLHALAREKRFVPQRFVVEVVGVCPACAASGSAT